MPPKKAASAQAEAYPVYAQPRPASGPWIWLAVLVLLGLASLHLVFRPLAALRAEYDEKNHQRKRAVAELLAKKPGPQARLDSLKKHLPELEYEIGRLEKSLQQGKATTWVSIGLMALM